jgi:hypothetical protein
MKEVDVALREVEYRQLHLEVRDRRNRRTEIRKAD